MRTTIDYGIDLGATSSAIARMENGTPVIIKSDVQKDTIPSCVHFNFNGRQPVLVGDSAMGAMKHELTGVMMELGMRYAPGEIRLNSYIEFKRTMGTSYTYRSRHMDRSFSSEELSSEVLKKLKSLVLDENISSIVVTVPAKFLSPQNEATIKAAKLSGFKQVVLLQEPIAAAMAYGLDAEKKDGYWLVFDFGGGTFDAALVKAEEGILSVKDTEGDNRLGGKNLDEAIIDRIILPHLQKTYRIEGILNDTERREILRNGLKWLAEDAKIQMSFKDVHTILSDVDDLPFEDEYGQPTEVDIDVTQKDMEYVLSPIFQKAIDIAKEVLKRNNLRGDDLDALILVGGPTYSPILWRMLREQITDKVDTSKDPMTVVAQGAALYASTIPITVTDDSVTPSPNTLFLDVKYNTPTVPVHPTELVTIQASKEKSTVPVPDEMFVEIRRNDEGWSSGLKRVSDKKATIFKVQFEENRPNSFEIRVFDEYGNPLKSEPGQFTVIHGFGVLHPTLSYHIGIAKYFEDKDACLFFPVKGLEKNKQLPATGVANGLRLRQEIRKGNANDRVRIPIYQGDYNAAGADPEQNHLVYEVVITGKTIPGTLPEGSAMDITIKVDESQTMHFSAYFPSLDYTEEMEIEIKQAAPPSPAELAKQIVDVKEKAKKAGISNIVNKCSELEERLENEKGSADGLMNIQDNLKGLIRDLPHNDNKWQEVEQEMTKVNNNLNKEAQENEELSPEDETEVNNCNRKMRKIIADRDIKEAKKLTEDMNELIICIMSLPKKIVMFFLFFEQSINDPKNWSDYEMAIVLVNGGVKFLKENKILERGFKFLKKDDVSELEPIIGELQTLWIGTINPSLQPPTAG
jgi:molecular chaperone DnaK